MSRPCLPSMEEDDRRIDSRDKPQQHAHQIHPNRMLHPNLPILLRRRLSRDINPSENPKQRRPKDEQEPVPAEAPVALDEWDAVDDYRDGGESADDFGVDPFGVAVGTFLVRVVEVDGVEAADCEGEDELEEAQNQADEGAGEASGGGVIADALDDTHCGWCGLFCGCL